MITRCAAAREGAGARKARPGSACSSCPGPPLVSNVARVWWLYHVYVIVSGHTSGCVDDGGERGRSEGVGRVGGAVL